MQETNNTKTGISQIKFTRFGETNYVYTKDFVHFYEDFIDCRNEVNEKTFPTERFKESLTTYLQSRTI